MGTRSITMIPGDGIGPEVVGAAIRVVNATGFECQWDCAHAGESALRLFYGAPLPNETLDSIARNGVALKGPTNTPTGHGHRSVNVALRKHFDLYANVRPVKTLPAFRRNSAASIS